MLDAMGLPEFRCTLSGSAPPAGCAPALAALWWAAKGDWNQAHRLVMELSGKDAAWVHAYLHRVEGDLANARYWYREAGRPVAKASLDQEWTTIAEELLQGVSD